jgi:hypothetical protein
MVYAVASKPHQVPQGLPGVQKETCQGGFSGLEYPRKLPARESRSLRRRPSKQLCIRLTWPTVR